MELSHLSHKNKNVAKVGHSRVFDLPLISDLWFPAAKYPFAGLATHSHSGHLTDLALGRQHHRFFQIKSNLRGAGASDTLTITVVHCQ